MSNYLIEFDPKIQPSYVANTLNKLVTDLVPDHPDVIDKVETERIYLPNEVALKGVYERREAGLKGSWGHCLVDDNLEVLKYVVRFYADDAKLGEVGLEIDDEFMAENSTSAETLVERISTPWQITNKEEFILPTRQSD